MRPDKTDKASAGRTSTCPHRYDARWEEIAGIFPRRPFCRLLRQYAESTKTKKGTAKSTPSSSRRSKAGATPWPATSPCANPSLSTHELNYAVQATIDRIIFLRICEDRGTEAYGRLAGPAQRPQHLRAPALALSRGRSALQLGPVSLRSRAWQSGAPDGLTLALTIDDKPLKEIIGRSIPRLAYEFSVLPADILGQVYEQFLGK